MLIHWQNVLSKKLKMSLHKKVLLGFLLLVTTFSISQEKEKESNKGKMFVFWGWNRASYSNSDIHFKGANYDFILSDVKAKDRITPFSFYDYLNPTRITIPQTNFRIGYFFHDNYSVSIGVEHMKYVMTPYQLSLIHI